jgi:hypothetical protein
MTEAWDRVRAELDIWAAEKRTAAFWWRDDDATDVSRELTAMLALARAHDVTIGVSAIPAKLTRRLVSYLGREAHVQVLVHGFAHLNHARPGQAKREFGGTRSLAEMTGDLTEGLRLARAAFGREVLPVLVPPWNRIHPRAVAALPGLGYRGMSTWKPRPSPHPVSGLVQVNTHLDIIDWRRGKALKDERLIAALLLRKLRWRRERRARAAEPLGLLTHHAFWTQAKERIIARLLDVTQGHPAVRWLEPQTAFGL